MTKRGERAKFLFLLYYYSTLLTIHDCIPTTMISFHFKSSQIFRTLKIQDFAVIFINMGMFQEFARTILKSHEIKKWKFYSFTINNSTNIFNA